jgi:hypothetical protein
LFRGATLITFFDLSLKSIKHDAGVVDEGESLAPSVANKTFSFLVGGFI